MEIRFQPYRKSGTWGVYWKSPWTGAHHHRGFYTQEEAENFVKGLSDIYNKRMSGIHLAMPVFSKGYRPKQGKAVP